MQNAESTYIESVQILIYLETVIPSSIYKTYVLDNTFSMNIKFSSKGAFNIRNQFCTPCHTSIICWTPPKFLIMEIC